MDVGREISRYISKNMGCNLIEEQPSIDDTKVKVINNNPS